MKLATWAIDRRDVIGPIVGAIVIALSVLGIEYHQSSDRARNQSLLIDRLADIRGMQDVIRETQIAVTKNGKETLENQRLIILNQVTILANTEAAVEARDLLQKNHAIMQGNAEILRAIKAKMETTP